MISAITNSLDEACAFMRSQDQAATGNSLLGLRKARSTLVIAPSAGKPSTPSSKSHHSLIIIQVLLNGWQDEIQRSVISMQPFLD